MARTVPGTTTRVRRDAREWRSVVERLRDRPVRLNWDGPVMVLASKELRDAAGELIPHALVLAQARCAWVCCYELVGRTTQGHR